jgi:peptidyl-prolyl cis-trans isomerase SurA
MMRLLLTLNLSLFMSVLTLQAQSKPDPVVMTVNGVPVTRSEFVYSYYKNNGTGQADRMSVEAYAECYANYKLKVAAALEARLDTSVAFRQALAMYSGRQSGGTAIGPDLLTEARSLYDRMKKTIGTQGLIRPAEIFLRLSTRASSKEQDRIAQRSDSIWRALQAGADFAALARKVSEDEQTAVQGGDKGWMQPHQSFVEFEQAAYALQVGELSRPILAPDGYHIILMKERKQLEPFGVLKDELLRSLRQQHLKQAVAGQKVGEVASQTTDANQQFLQQEYHDGLLVYELTNREVWQRAKADEAGLRAWFDTHKKAYVSEGPHYRGLAYYTKTKADMKAVKKYLKRLPFEQWAEALRSTFNSNGAERVKMEVGVFKPGDNATIDRQVFKRRDVTVQADVEFPFEAVYGKKLKKYPESYNDVRAQVVADYQQKLETEWVASLRSRYPVQINQELLKTVNQYQ